MICSVVLSSAALYNDVLCCEVLCHVMCVGFCSVVLCCVYVLCSCMYSAVLCCVVLCSVM